MNERIREISQLDRLVHEPARLQILMFLQDVEEADFLYLLREGGFTQGNLSTIFLNWRMLGTSAFVRCSRGRRP